MEEDKLEDTSDVLSVAPVKSITMSSAVTTPSDTENADTENEELQRLVHAPPFWRNRKRLSKQLSMCETPRDIAWERRRRQMLLQERRKQRMNDSDDLTDDDLKELKACIELGFGFSEEEGQKLCNTLPALDLYFAVNRQFSMSPVLSPNSKGSTTSATSLSTSLGARSSSFDSPTTSDSTDSWKICSPEEKKNVSKKLEPKVSFTNKLNRYLFTKRG